MRKLNPSRLDILSLIYIRTILELEIKYDDKGNIIDKGRLNATMMVIYTRIVCIEKTLFRVLKSLYMECLEVAKVVWLTTKADKEQFSIEIEPVICGIYFDREKQMKKLGLVSIQFSNCYDEYFRTSNGEYEVVSRKLVDEIFKNSEKVLFDFKKRNKRG